MSEDLVVEVENLSVSYGTNSILRNLHFSLAVSEKCVIAGSNGAGKTTFLKVLLGLIPPVSGKVAVFGAPVGSPEWMKRRSRTGYVNQEAVRLDFPISAREVVEIGLVSKRGCRREKRAAVLEAMEKTGSSALLNRSFSRLSGGEKQRVSLARCLVQNPRILFLDEPTASLDPDARTTLLELLDEIELPVLMVSHDQSSFSRTGWRMNELRDGGFA